MKVLVTRITLFLAIFLSINHYTSYAEGTKQLEWNTNGVSKLQVGRDRSLVPIATYDSPAESRYYIHIGDPGQEMVYFGFGKIFDDIGTKPCFFRIKDPNGNIVFPVGPGLTEMQVPTAGQGYIATRDQAVLGPQNLGGGAGGYDPLSFKPTVKGDHYIEFRFDPTNDLNNRVIFDNFDITVANTTTNLAINGRFWAYQWNLYSMKNGSKPTEARFFVYTTDQVVTRLDLNGMEPMGHVVMCNSMGTEAGIGAGNTFEERRKSAIGNKAYPEYKIFLNDPDSVFYPSYVNPLEIKNVALNGCNSTGNICQGIGVYVSKKVVGEIFLDIGATPTTIPDGIYTPNSRDKIFTVNLEVGDNCVPWDGLDEQKVPVTSGEPIGVHTKVLSGLTNFPIYDPEINRKGIKVKLIRPVNQNSKNPVLLHWDDSNIGGTTSPARGCLSNPDNIGGADGCHSWPNPFGDNRTMNTWWNVFNITNDTTIHFTKGPIANAGGPFPVCSKNNIIEIGTPVAVNNGDTYEWKALYGETFEGGTSNPLEKTLPNPKVDLSNLTINTPGIAFYELTVRRQGCFDKDTAEVIINTNGKANITGPKAVCPESVDIPYLVKDARATAWRWEIVDPTEAKVDWDEPDVVGIGDSITIDWLDPTHRNRTTTIRLISSYPGCPDDVTLFPVKISDYLQTPVPSGPAEVCVDPNKVIEYSVPLTPHTTYDWYISSVTNRFEPFGSFPTGNVAKIVFTTANQNGAIMDRVGVRATYANPDPAKGVCNDQHVRYLDVKVKPDVPLFVHPVQPELCSGGTAELKLLQPFSSDAHLYDFKWSMPHGFADPVETTKWRPKVSLITNKLDSVKYYITVTSIADQCSKTDSVYVIVRPKPKVEVLSSNTVCKEKALTSHTYSLKTKYAGTPTWKVIPANAATPSTGSGLDFTVKWDTSKAHLNPFIEYRVPNDNDTSRLCSPVVDSIKIAFRKFPTRKPIGGSALCFSNPESIYSVKSNGGGNVYQWIGGETSGDFTFEPLSHKDGSNDSIKIKWNVNKDANGKAVVGPWWVTVKQEGTQDDNCYDNDLDTLFVNFFDEGIIKLTGPDSTQICLGDSILLDVNLGPGPGKSEVKWNDSLGLTDGAPKILKPLLIGNQEWKMAIATYNPEGCPGRDTMFIKVNPIPEPLFYQKDYTFCPDSDTLTTVFTNGGFEGTYSWEPPDGWQPKNGLLTEILVSKGQIYWLTVVSKENCKNKDFVEVKEVCPPRIFVPRAFTPNKDNTNDMLEIFGDYFQNFEMKVLNRWGEVVFTTTDKEKLWDGTYNGEDMPAGVYPWIITYESMLERDRNNPYQMKGSVTIIR